MKQLDRDEWRALRDTRLAALRDSPDAFLATYAQEMTYDEDRWRTEFDRGEWSIGIQQGKPVSLLGVTREPHTSSNQCYLEFVWVSPACRRSGVGIRMLTDALGRLQASGVRAALLWVLDGNDAAIELYKRLGFIGANCSQPLPTRPGRTEELMQLDLQPPPHTADLEAQEVLSSVKGGEHPGTY